MSQVGSVTHLLQQFKAGDEAALGVLMRRYWPFLLARAGERLPPAYRRAADEEDVAQQVVWAVYQGLEGGHWQQLANRQDLVALLNRITECKAINQLKSELRDKRGGGKVPEPLYGAGSSSTGSGPVAPAPGLSPQEEVLQDDWCRHCLNRLGRELRPVAELLLAGCSQKEIAAVLRCSERTVARKVPLIRMKWLQFMAEAGDGVPAP
jgi:DNA-directed RNA polymerase specialized sigma24 family protein